MMIARPGLRIWITATDGKVCVSTTLALLSIFA